MQVVVLVPVFQQANRHYGYDGHVQPLHRLDAWLQRHQHHTCKENDIGNVIGKESRSLMGKHR